MAVIRTPCVASMYHVCVCGCFVAQVKFRVFGYVRFGFNACQHQMQVTAGGGGAGPGAVRLGECVLGWTNLIKQRDDLHLTFIDLKVRLMTSIDCLLPSYCKSALLSGTYILVSPA